MDPVLWNWTAFLAGAAVGTVLHEAGHAAAAAAFGAPVKAIHMGVGREIARKGELVLHLWPIALGVELADEHVDRMPLWARTLTHLAGPAANLALALALWRTAPLAGFANAVLCLSNAAPLPYTDGGWAITGILSRIRGGGIANEYPLHRRLALPAWTLAAFAALAAAWFA